MVASQFKLPIILLLGLFMGGYIQPGALVVLAIFFGLVILFVILLGLTYRRALKMGKNSCGMYLLGRNRCMSFLFCLISNNNRNRSNARNNKDAVSKIQTLKKHPIALQKNNVCLIGSSTFNYWRHYVKDLQPYKVYNAAFGGSKTTDLLLHMQGLVFDHEPSLIVYYCGSNDILSKATAKETLFGFQQFVQKTRKVLPLVKFMYVCPLMSPLNIYSNKISVIEELIALGDTYVQQEKNIWICNPNLVSEDLDKSEDDMMWTSNPKYYLYDGLHLTNDGHRMLAKAMLPIMFKVGKE